jgi:hypothetical protein
MHHWWSVPISVTAMFSALFFVVATSSDAKNNVFGSRRKDMVLMPLAAPLYLVFLIGWVMSEMLIGFLIVGICVSPALLVLLLS